MKDISKFGQYCALAATIATAGYDVVQLMQVAGLLKYPADAIVIYGFSLLIPVPFILAVLALHYSAPQEKKIWTHAALLFSVVYATYVLLNYVVQLTTVIPMSLQGRGEEIRVLDQTPHSLFWDVDALGYIFLALATLFASFRFSGRGLEGWVKGFFLANALVTPLICIVYFYPTFSYTLLLLFGTPWIITATGSMLMLVLFFRRRRALA
ncbi:MAG: hypothetical protein PHI18_00905 [bacterium]|nr:hypothetical protein [bacterium]